MSFYETGRNSRQVVAPPGGHSSITFGSEPPPPSPGKAAAQSAPAVPPAEPAPAAAPAEDVEVELPEPEDEGPTLDVLKLQAIGAIATAKDEKTVRDALATLIKTLQIAATAEDVPAAANGSRAAPTANGSAAAGAAAAANGDSTFPALEALKAALKLRGTHGIITLGKKFRSMDDDGDRKLSYDEFKKAANEMKLPLSEADMTKLFRYFDRDESGYVTFDEMLLGLRGQLNERRTDMVKRAFKILDRNGDGTVTLADLEGRYDASQHPDVVSGNKSQRQVLLEFLSVFEAQGGGTAGDGAVTLEEFMLYYSMVSSSVDDDDYFELMMRNVWHISGGEGWCANTSCKRVLVTHSDGTQEVVEVTDDFDVDVKDVEAVKRKLIEQGVQDIKSIALYGDMASSESGGGGPSTSAAASNGGASTSAAATNGGPLSPPSAPGDGPSPRPSTGRRTANPNANRSSIIFG